MNQNVDIADFVFKRSVWAMVDRLAEMAGVSEGYIYLLLVAVVVLFVAIIALRYGELLLFALIRKPAPPEPAPLPFNSDLNPVTAQVFLGREGTVQAPLRPMGIAKVDGRIITVKSEGPYIDAGTAVRVDRIEGPHIIVVPAVEEV